MTQLPAMTTSVTTTSDNQLLSAFANALSAGNKTATPSNLTVNVQSTANWLNLTTTMTVLGVTNSSGDILSVNMGWKAFKVSTNLMTGNLSYNTVGEKYFLPVTALYGNLSRLVGHGNATQFTSINFYVNQTAVSATTADNYVGNFTMFNFQGLDTPVDTWPRVYSLTNDTTSWRITPIMPTIPIDFAITAQKANRTTRIFASAKYDAEISVSGIARAQGDAVSLGVGSGRRELAMTGVVALAVILAIVSQFLFRSRKKKYARFGRR
jgi:hypothetical protein